MRVLVTGMTNQHCGKGTRMRYSSVTHSLIEALHSIGVKIDHRAVSLDDELTEYTAMLIGVFNPAAIGSGMLYGMAHAVQVAEKRGIPYAMYVDDWQLRAIGKTTQRFVKKGVDTLVRPNLKGMRLELDAALERKDYVGEGLTRALVNPRRMLIPAYRWGDYSTLLRLLGPCAPRKPYFFDPSPFAIDYGVVAPPEKERAWVCGTLSNYQDWIAELELEWPVYYLGGKKSKADVLVHENELVEIYASCWGVLCPPYGELDGSGWWRNRFVYARDVGSILYCAREDGVRIGPSYSTSAREIEKLSDEGLESLAEAQTDDFSQFGSTCESTTSEIAKALDL